ncbi:MAG: cation-translocating P-type ATPase [Devosia sp.]|nr:cation-translocating P-type ATPase [Devosia sp.]
MPASIIANEARVGPRVGLSAAEAAERLAREGPNELPSSARRTPFRIALEVLKEPMLLLLLVGGGIYLLLGDLTEAIVLLVFASLSILITVVQEVRTERVLEALRDLTSPRALVIRDGQRLRIAGRDVVRGDLIVLGEGDRVPADAEVLECQDLEADESLLTGESVPVRKIAADGSAPHADRRPGGDALPSVYAGSLVVRGRGVAEVTATGATSEIGRIGQSLATLETEPPRLQAQTRRLVKVFAVFGAMVSLLVVLLSGTLRGDWLAALLSGIAVGMSMLPEEFPVVLTVFMAMGAWRISRARVLTRRAAAIETLGSATVLCTDKTGTLTENRMAIVEVRLLDGSSFRSDGEVGGLTSDLMRQVVEFGILASAAEPIDPMEKAFHAFGTARLDPDGRLQQADWRMVREFGLAPDLLAMSRVWQTGPTAADLAVAAKGAPEAIADLCRLEGTNRATLLRAVDEMAAEGLRVLAVARASADGIDGIASQRDFAFTFLGLVGLADALRASVPAAVRDCRAAGIRVVMITGDYPETARAIARAAGIGGDDLITGPELAGLSDGALAIRARTATVFARIMPEQKLRIVNALKADGEVVAMTGDGVNDAPSLKAAHIGIAMGGRGTDVAREASSIVLLDDDFGSIVAAIRLGRRIYDNLRKAMTFIIAVHIPVAGLALLPLIFGLPTLLGPLHIAFLEMVIDPACTLAFEAEDEEADIMRRPPRRPDEPLFGRRMVVWGLLQGFLAFALAGGMFVTGLSADMPEDEIRALSFFSLVLAIVALILVNRSASSSLRSAFSRPSLALMLVLAGVAVMLAVVLLWPFASSLFHFGALRSSELFIALGAGFGMVVVLDLLKPMFRSGGKSLSPSRPAGQGNVTVD